MHNENPYESPELTNVAALAFESPSTRFDLVRAGAMNACWASLMLVVLHMAVPILTKLGWRSPFEFTVRTGLQVAATVWLACGINQMRSVSAAARARHLLTVSLLSWGIFAVLTVLIPLQWLVNISFMPSFSFVIADAASFIGKLTLLWAVCRIGRKENARQIVIAATTAMFLLTLTDLPYLTSDLTSVLFADGPRDHETLQAQLVLLDKPVEWALYLLMQSAGLYALYALANLPECLETDQDDQATEPRSWRQDFQPLWTYSGFQWGISFCWWAVILGLIIPRACRLLSLPLSPETLTYAGLALWSNRLSYVCQLLGLALLWTIPHERVKSWFAWGAICLFAGISFDLLQHYNGQEMDLDGPQGQHVVFVADVLPIVSLWCLLKGLHEFASAAQDSELERSARRSLLRYYFLGALWFMELAIIKYSPEIFFDLLSDYQFATYATSFLVHLGLEVWLLLSYIPQLNKTAAIAEQAERFAPPIPLAESAHDPDDS